MLKSLSESSVTQLASANLEDLQQFTENQLVQQNEEYKSKKDGGLFENMQKKLDIQENIQVTKDALHQIKEHKKSASDSTPEPNSPGQVVESAAGSVIPAQVPTQFATVEKKDITFGAHGFKAPDAKNVQLRSQ